jgi:hypothetical protein
MWWLQRSFLNKKHKYSFSCWSQKAWSVVGHYIVFTERVYKETSGATPNPLLDIIDYYMAFFILHVISTRDIHISPIPYHNLFIIYRLWTKVFVRFQYFLYIHVFLFFSKNYPEINSCLILIIYIFHIKLVFFFKLSWSQFMSNLDNYFINKSRKICGL